MRYEDCTELFSNLLFHDDIISCRSLFILNDYKVNYRPPYQRNYMWTYVKGTNYIETLLLYREANPIVWIECLKQLELIDGRQRFETLKDFINDKFTLKKSGLDKIRILTGQKFSKLDVDIQNRIADTPIRVIKIFIKNDNLFDEVKLDKIKREIFYRYNIGILPLKKEETSKAYFLNNRVVNYFKNKLEKDFLFLNQVKAVFDHRNKNLEVLLQHIRRILVIQHIPTSRLAYGKDEVVNKFFEYLTIEVNEQNSQIDLYRNFQEKIYFLHELLPDLRKKFDGKVGLVSECIYWVLSVCELEKIKFDVINQPSFRAKLIKHICENKAHYSSAAYYRAVKVKGRFECMASFFEGHFNCSLSSYLKSSPKSIEAEKAMEKILHQKIVNPVPKIELADVHLVTKSVREIIDLVDRKVLNIQPEYQRQESDNYLIASSLIESVLFNLTLHPIYLFQRLNDEYEVIDGQQRLLTILAFMGKSYFNNKGEETQTKKHGFSLRLLGNKLHRKTYDKLSQEQQTAINNFKLQLIVIKEKDFPDFKPEEFFIRINYKPCPIKPHSFELWNSYIDNRIIRRIKELRKDHVWLKLQNKDKRMLNEELVTFLVFLTLKTMNEPCGLSTIKKVIQIHFNLEVPAVRLKSRANVTQTLENPNHLDALIHACNLFEKEFVAKVELLYGISSNSRKTQRNEFYSTFWYNGSISVMTYLILWIILSGISMESISENTTPIKEAINDFFKVLRGHSNKDEFENMVEDIWKQFKLKPANTRSKNKLQVN